MKLLSVAVLALVLLSGCADEAPPEAAPSGLGSGPQAEAAGTLAFKALAAPVAKTLWANGTVAFQDTCNTGGCILDTSRAIRPTDLSAELPAGVPVTVRLELTYTPHAVLADNFDAWVQSDGALFYGYSYEADPGVRRIETTLLPGGRTEAVMGAFGPGGGLPDTPYVFRIDIAAHPSVVPEGVPVAVALGPGESVAANATGVDVLVYGPDDAFLGSFREPFTVPTGARRGDYAVMLSGGASMLTVGNVSKAPAMRPLGLAFETGPEAVLPPHGTVSSTWDVTGQPLGVGLAAYNVAGPTGQWSLASAGFQVSIAGPNGWSVSSGNLCGFCLTFGEFNVWLGSGLGNAAVTAGTYTVEAESTFTHEIRLAPVALRLLR